MLGDLSEPFYLEGDKYGISGRARPPFVRWEGSSVFCVYIMEPIYVIRVVILRISTLSAGIVYLYWLKQRVST